MNDLEGRLVKLVLSGNRNAFQQLVGLYQNKIYRLAFRMLGQTQEAEDVVQETFLRVYKNLHRYDQKQKFSTWIFRIASNLCIDRLRRRKKKISLDAAVKDQEGSVGYDMLSSTEISPEEQVVLSETQLTVRQALDTLPEKYKSIMILRYLHELSLQEVSDILQIPVTTVKTRLHRGREYVRKRLNQDHP